MTLQIDAIQDALTSHALALGIFERVNEHASANAPGRGLTCEIVLDRMEAARAQSGLNTTSARVTYAVRIFADLVADPEDDTERAVLRATDALWDAYSGDFTLGGLARGVDLLGQTGPGLRAETGYLKVSGQVFRMVEMSVPLIVNDVWEQVP